LSVSAGCHDGPMFDWADLEAHTAKLLGIDAVFASDEELLDAARSLGRLRAVLDAAETRVLVALCQGIPPGAAAAEIGVGIATVRTQIGSIRQKTGAQSIRALVRQVAVLPPLMGALRQVMAPAPAVAHDEHLVAA